MEDYKPIYGKTYSLFGKDANTGSFYQKISALTDEILAQLSMKETQALENIQRLGRNRQRLKTAIRKPPGTSGLADIMHMLNHSLSEYTPGIEQHLREVSLHKYITDRELLKSREQHYLYMIEIELVNRIYKENFHRANFRIALLPYCLKEFQTDCKASPDKIDYVCRKCSGTCYINKVSKLLKEHDISPYIWSRGSLRSMFRKLTNIHGSIAVLGIACLVELVRGMRLCMKVKLPVMGIPLNANRCSRWMDNLYETSMDLSALESMLSKNTDI